MAADPGLRVIGRLAIVVRATVHRAEIGRIARVARLGARECARPGQAARHPVHQVPGQVASNVRTGTVTTTTGVARVGLGRGAGGADGTSQWWLKRALPQAPRLWRHKSSTRRPSSQPKARRSSPLCRILNQGSRCACRAGVRREACF